MKTLAIQVVLYNQSRSELEKLFQCLAWLMAPVGYSLQLRTGDGGEATEIDDSFVSGWSERFASVGIGWTHTKFDGNVGFGKGHNLLFKQGESDRVWLLNPDAYFARDIVIRLGGFADAHSDFGIVEPRSLPIEHAKAIDFQTCETGWCSGFAPLISSSAFQEVGGFDERFFLYEEDVDLSWRIKATGRKLYCCPSASVYHAHVGGVSDWSRKWSQVSELLLLKKYRRKGHLVCRLSDLAVGDESFFRDVLQIASESKMKVATQREIGAASWTGRMVSPLRWGPYALRERGGKEANSVLVRSVEGNELALIESLLSAWSAGASRVGLDAPDDTRRAIQGALPFELEPPDSKFDASITEGQIVLNLQLENQTWAKLFTQKIEGGYLNRHIEKDKVAEASSVWRVDSEHPLAMIADEEGWRFTVRQMRARLRLLKLGTQKKKLIQDFLKT